VQELTPELAAYFGAKDGVLVASVQSDSPASRAGLQAGDVIVSVDGDTIGSRTDLQRALREPGESGRDVKIGIVRDKKESSVAVRIEAPERREPRRVRPVRPVRPINRSAEL
jgi:S1-C subfamily serine protease